MPSATTSNYLHVSQLRELLHGTTFTYPTVLYVGLWVTTPTDYGTILGAQITGTEVATGAGTNYARVPINCVNGAGGWTNNPVTPNFEFSNASDIVFNVPGATNWGQITGAGLWDAATGGKLIFIANLTSPKQVNSGDGAPKILQNQLRILRAIC